MKQYKEKSINILDKVTLKRLDGYCNSFHKARQIKYTV